MTNKSVISRPMGGFSVDVDANFLSGKTRSTGPRLVAVGRRCCGGFEQVKVRDNDRRLTTVTCECVTKGAAA